MPSTTSAAGFKPLKDTVVFTPVEIGALKLGHRIIQAPTTRMRGVEESPRVFVCGDDIVNYYEQRASKGGLQLSEATNICRMVSCQSLCHMITHLTYHRLLDIQAVQEFSHQDRLPHGSV